jgi:aspartyl-tRNA(Asn)/glutamyl-tRNA(Gln) amidotransferase subunit C
MKIDEQIIDRISTLAKLEFSGEAKKQIEADMNAMLDFIDKLNELDTDQVEPLIYMTDEVNRLRPDVVTSDTSREEALKNAPNADSYYFKVPKVIDDKG